MNDDNNDECPSYYALADRLNSLVFMITAFISAAASYVTIRECIADILCRRQQHQQQRRDNCNSKALPRFILSLNAGYFIYFFAKIFGPIPVPATLRRDDVSNKDCGVWGAYGTIQTCTAQGFFIQLGVWSFAFHLVLLVWYYMAIVVWNWREGRLRKHVTWATSTIWTICFCMAILGLFWDVFNFKDQNCYISVYPPGCLQEGTCVRGGHTAYIYGWIVKTPYFFVVLLMSIFFVLTFRAVRKRENQASMRSQIYSQSYRTVHHDQSSSTAIVQGDVNARDDTQQTSHSRQAHDSSTRGFVVDRSKSNSVAFQGILLAGYTIVVVFVVLFEMFAPLFVGYKNYWFHIFKTCMDNLQGFVFFVIFSRTRHDSMLTWEGRFLRRIVYCVKIRKWIVASQKSSRSSSNNNISNSGGNSGGDGMLSSSAMTNISVFGDQTSRLGSSSFVDDEESLDSAEELATVVNTKPLDGAGGETHTSSQEKGIPDDNEPEISVEPKPA